MKWILFIMLFTTTPYQQDDKHPKVESEHSWTLQSATSMDFATEPGCRAAGLRIVKAVEPVGNLTFRGYCLCESTDPKKVCPPINDKTEALIEKSLKGAKPEVSTGIITIGPGGK